MRKNLRSPTFFSAALAGPLALLAMGCTTKPHPGSGGSGGDDGGGGQGTDADQGGGGGEGGTGGGGMGGGHPISCDPSSVDMAGCSCDTQGGTRDCGPVDKAGVGPCKKGQQMCMGQTVLTWGPCEGAVFPGPEMCKDGIDNDCNGKTDCEDPACKDACQAPPPDAAPPMEPTCPDGGVLSMPNQCTCGPTCTPGQFKVCDAYCGVFQQCQADGTWGPCQFCDNTSGCTCVNATCTHHTDCPHGYVCDYARIFGAPKYGGCESGYACKTDADCKGKTGTYGPIEHCWVEQGVCIDNCRSHSDCPAGVYCDEGHCQFKSYKPMCLSTPPPSCR